MQRTAPFLGGGAEGFLSPLRVFSLLSFFFGGGREAGVFRNLHGRRIFKLVEGLGEAVYRTRPAGYLVRRKVLHDAALLQALHWDIPAVHVPGQFNDM